MPAVAPVDPAALAELIAHTRWGRVEVVASTGSTNSDLAARVAEGAPSGQVLISEHQSAGRGRFARVWTAPPGANLALSVLVAPDKPFEEWTWLPLLTGMAVTRALRRLAPDLVVQLKWPNDVLIESGHPGKLCGILSEAHLTPSGPMAVVGLGINVGLDADELPVPTASSLALCGVQVTKTELAAAVLVELDALLAQWEADQAGLRQSYLAECSSMASGLKVIVSDTETVHGTGVDVDTQGRLVVQTEQGRRTFAAGDVVHLRR